MKNDEIRKWVDQTTGLDCLILRMDLGHLCGYVRVKEWKRQPFYVSVHGDDWENFGVVFVCPHTGNYDIGVTTINALQLGMLNPEVK